MIRSLPPIGVPACSSRLRIKSVNCVRWGLKGEDFKAAENGFELNRKTWRSPLHRPVTQLGRDDDAGTDLILADPADVLGNAAVRVADQVGDDICIEGGSASKLDRIGRLVSDRRKIFVERLKGLQKRQQGLRRGGFDDQPGALLSHDCVLTGEFEFPWGSRTAWFRPFLE